MGIFHSSKKAKVRRRGRGWLAAKRANKSKEGCILYLMVHFPLICFVKIGITGRTARARAADIDEAVWGFPVPVFVLFVPGAYFWEQTLHGLCGLLSVRFYDGDGASEWFWFPAAIPALLFMLAGWGFYFWIFTLCSNWDSLEWYLLMLKTVWGWALNLIKMF